MADGHGSELEPGDTVEYDGEVHRVTQVECHEGWAWPVASDGTGWAAAVSDELRASSRHSAQPALP